MFYMGHRVCITLYNTEKNDIVIHCSLHYIQEKLCFVDRINFSNEMGERKSREIEILVLTLEKDRGTVEIYMYIEVDLLLFPLLCL